MKRTYFAACAFLVISHFVAGVSFAGDWKKDFENICGKTELAEQMTTDELINVISECKKVKKEAEASSDPRKKVYLFRIKKCLNFYEFMRQTRS